MKGGVQDDSVKDAEAFGLTIPEPKKDEFVVWDENWEVVTMFRRMSTQWETSMSGIVGLKYESLKWLCDLYWIEDRREMFEGIQLMEYAAIRALREDK